MRYIALVLRIDFKFELDKLSRDIERISKLIRRPFSTGMHTKGGISFVIVTTERASALLERMRAELDDIHSVSNYWCHMAPIDLAGKYGDIDPFLTRVKEAWNNVGQRNNPEHVNNPQRRRA